MQLKSLDMQGYSYSYTTHPPIPELSGQTTPMHKVVAMAASTAEPPFFRIFSPMIEH
jgi:hypothetical protein